MQNHDNSRRSHRARPLVRAVHILLILGAFGSWIACASRGTSSGEVRRASNATTATPPAFFGYVLQADSTPAVGANVWSEPASVVAVTDSSGFWEISEGLVPGQYDVRSELEGIGGRARRVVAEFGRSARVVVLLGAEDTEWPPPIGFDSILPRPTRGPGEVRGSCCER